MSTIKESIISTIHENGLPIDLAGYILATIELSGGNVNAECADNDQFCRTFERFMLSEFGHLIKDVVVLPVSNLGNPDTQ